MKLKLLLVVGLAIFGMTAASAHAAGPFEKAGLSKKAGKVLTDKEADQVRGGFRGARSEEMRAVMESVMASLGVDTSGGRESVRTQLEAAGITRDAVRTAMQAAMADAGIEPPSFEAGSRPQPPNGVGGRSGVRGQRARMGRR